MAQFPRNGDAEAGTFDASPIVVNGTLFVGTVEGYFYALDADTLELRWRYPRIGSSDKPLVGDIDRFRYGISSSASYWNRAPNGAVIFGAQDPLVCAEDSSLCSPDHKAYGSARLFALDAASGNLIWKSDVIAKINGTTYGCPNPNCPGELHQRLAYSSPLIFGDRVYVGISSFPEADDGFQVGSVVAVDLAGRLDRRFHFQAVGAAASPPGTLHGGGIWNSLAVDSSSGVYFTTGNTNLNPTRPSPEPVPDYALSMMRINKDTGNVVWQFQPVPFTLDGDDDWAAGAAVMATSCGELVASVQKDGWAYAIDAETGACRWQFPPDPVHADHNSPRCSSTGYSKFEPTGPLHTGLDYYHRPGAAWKDVLIVSTGGEIRVNEDADNGGMGGIGKLHALNACAASEEDRVRWIADIPHGAYSSFGTPTVTGGIVFVGAENYLVILADPSVVPVPPERYTCANQYYTTASDCSRAGFKMVPSLSPLAPPIAMPDGGSIGPIRHEPVLAQGRVFVATNAGHVYMLEPETRSR